MINAVSGHYHGHKRLDFSFNDKDAILVVPNAPKKGNPWLFRAEFFGAFDNVDMMLVDNGWHIAYIKVSDMFGHPDATQIMKQFRDHLVSEYELSQKVVICGMSRGGLYAVNYAVEYPEDIAGLYLDAPVLTLMSWPFGLGKGCGSVHDTELCKNVWKLNESTILNFRENPIDKIDLLLEKNVPVCLICGGADDVVPYEENGAELVRKYEAMHGNYKLFFKPECGHHPHSLDDPADAVSYIEQMI